MPVFSSCHHQPGTMVTFTNVDDGALWSKGVCLLCFLLNYFIRVCLCVCVRALDDTVNEPKCYFSIKVQVHETPLRSVPVTAEALTSSKPFFSSTHPHVTSLFSCSIFTSVRSALKCLERPYVSQQASGSQTHSWQLTSEPFPLWAAVVVRSSRGHHHYVAVTMIMSFMW